MIYRGHIKNGVAVLDEAVALPDGTPVRIEVEPVNSDFWTSRTVADLAREQAVKPIQSLNELVIDWPQEDAIDDLLALLREVRH